MVDLNPLVFCDRPAELNALIFTTFHRVESRNEVLGAMPKSAEQLELDKTVQAQADKLRGDFNQGLTRPIKHRLAQLNSFMKMMR